MNQLLDLAKREAQGELSGAQAADAEHEIVMRARLAMTDEDFLEAQRRILAFHHEIAKELSKGGLSAPGNDPRKPN
jgi:hypothetical protein